MKKTTISLFAASIIAINSNAADFKDLGTITVTSATNSNQSIKDVTSNVEVITGTELEEKHISTVLDALRTSGISITQSGAIGQQSSFFMNGFSSGNTLVLIDGVKYNDQLGTEGQAQLEHLMISDIEQIEIIKGAQSGTWGANAVAGVINIITKKATKDLKINANTEYGTYNTKKIGVNISQKIDKLSYYLGANYIKTDGISAKTPIGKNPEDYENDGYINKTINTKLGYAINNNDEVRLNLIDIYAKVKIDRTTPNDMLDEVTQKNRLYKIILQHNFDNKNYIETSYSKSNFKKEDPYVPPFWGQSVIQGYNEDMSVNTKISYLDNSFILVGLNKQNSEDEINKKEMKSKGIYLTNSNIIDKFIITESLRRDNYDLFEDKTTGKIGAKYSFTNDLSFDINYGTAYKTPSLNQLYTAFYGNVDLKPETTKSTDMSVEFKHIKLTYFDNKVTNIIGFDPISYVNEQVLGTSKLKGYEISYKNEIMQELLFDIKYNHLSAKDKDGKDLARRIHDSFKLGLDYYGVDKFHFGVFANYVGERFDDTAKTKQTGKYTLLNTVANYEVNKNLKTYLKVDNLTYKLYQEVDGYGTMGRTITVGLNATF